MPDYYVNEATFTLPGEGFVDRTVHMLKSPLSDDESLAVTVRRSPMPAGKSLRDVVDEETAASKKKIGSFGVVDETETHVAEVPAILLRARWRGGDVAHHQLQAHVVVDGTWIALAATAPYEHRAACEQTFERIVRSLAWRSA